MDPPACDAVVALGYLGGNADLDVLRARLEMDGNVCVLSNADQVDMSNSVKGMLDVSNGLVGDAFRLCRDDRTKPTDVGCNTPHTGEYVGVPAGAVPDQQGCEAAAKAYMSVGFSEVSGDLAVLALPTADPDDGRPRCVITVRGNQVLTASIRNVRTHALPLEAG
jgi:hypothetical protein